MKTVWVCIAPFAQELSIANKCSDNKRCIEVCKREAEKNLLTEHKNLKACIRSCEKSHVDNAIFKGHTKVERSCNRKFFRGNIKSGLMD
jgi:hypothetical protein